MKIELASASALASARGRGGVKIESAAASASAKGREGGEDKVGRLEDRGIMVMVIWKSWHWQGSVENISFLDQEVKEK